MKTETVHLYVFNTLADWEYGLAIARINNPSFQARPGRYRVETVGLTRSPVTTMGGVTILPDLTLEELRPQLSAMLILPGGDTWDQGQNSEAADKAVEFLAAGVPVAAICGATAGLARAGVLDDKRHTSNSPDYLLAVGYRGGPLYQDQPAVTDGLLITASGVASLDFAYHILRYLEVYDQRALDAWYGLFKTGDPAYYSALMEAVSHA